MRLHRNAKTTPAMRLLIVTRVRDQHWPVRAVAAAAGISVRTTYKWLARHRRAGVAALDDASSQPLRQPRRTRPDQLARILAARYTGLTAWRISQQVQVPRSTVAALLARAGLNRLRRLTPPGPVQRYEHAHPGDLVHLDMKPLARIGAVGHRIHGDLRRRRRGLGWEVVHVAIDDHSRSAYVEVLPDHRGPTAAGFLRRTVCWFAARGIQVRRVLTDNGPAYRSQVFRGVATRAGLRLRRTRPYRPQTNGKAERFIQTLLREWAYATPYASSWRRTRALRPWLRYYNTARPHTALGYQPPCFRFPRAAQ
jgi:transposase InsO family protein